MAFFPAHTHARARALASLVSDTRHDMQYALAHFRHSLNSNHCHTFVDSNPRPSGQTSFEWKNYDEFWWRAPARETSEMGDLSGTAAMAKEGGSPCKCNNMLFEFHYHYDFNVLLAGIWAKFPIAYGVCVHACRTDEHKYTLHG